MLSLLPQLTGHLLQAALTASALPRTSERCLSPIHHPLQPRRPNAGHRVPEAQVRKIGMQTLEGTGSSGNGVKSFRSILNKTPQAEPQTSSETQRPASEAVSFTWRAYTRHQWVCGAFTLRLGQRLLDSLTVRTPRARWLRPTITVFRSPQTGQVTYKTKGPAVANQLACAKQSLPACPAKTPPTNTPLLLHWKFAWVSFGHFGNVHWETP